MLSLWVRVGDSGHTEQFGDVEAVIDYLNELGVGLVTGFVRNGILTTNYHGSDFVAAYWGDNAANFVRPLNNAEQVSLEDALQPCEL